MPGGIWKQAGSWWRMKVPFLNLLWGWWVKEVDSRSSLYYCCEIGQWGCLCLAPVGGSEAEPQTQGAGCGGKKKQERMWYRKMGETGKWLMITKSLLYFLFLQTYHSHKKSIRPYFPLPAITHIKLYVNQEASTFLYLLTFLFMGGVINFMMVFECAPLW